jgi:predicted metal-dependent phosphoesterase TrpH
LKENQVHSDPKAQTAWIDLHVHTAYSDGLLTPAEMIIRAKAEGLAAIGIVDHDTIDGIDEAIEEGKCQGIEVVPGVELSSYYNGKDVHIIGYYFNPRCPNLADYLKIFRQERYRRAQKMIQNLEDTGIHLEMAEVEEKARGKCIGRPHLAEVLVDRGYVETIQEAFQRYIGYGSEAYEEKYHIQPEEAIRLITGAKGLAFLAHPGAGISETVITHFVKSGLDGVEVVHPFLYEERRRTLKSIANRLGLLISGGSDCHGGRDGMFYMGKHKVPYAFLEQIKKTHRSRWGDTPFSKNGFPETTC